MPSVKQRYIQVTREAKAAIALRKTAVRSAAEKRVFDAFRQQARSAYKALRRRRMATPEIKQFK